MKRLLCAAALALLTACGGGGMSGSPVPAGLPASNTRDPANTQTVSVLNQLNSTTVIGSTVDPVNGDQNPYGLDIAQSSAGMIAAGDLVVSNFNNAANVQGTGTTIIALHATPGSTPTHLAQSTTELLGPTELVVDSSDTIYNAVFVANRVSAFGPDGSFRSDLGGPWDSAFGITLARKNGANGERTFYVSNVGPSGSIVRIHRDKDGDRFTIEQIASGFAVNGGVPGTELGPGGLQYDNSRDRLYVVDGANNTIYYLSHVSSIKAGGVVVNSDGTTFSGPQGSRAHVLASGGAISGPISSALLFNGNLVIGNTTEPAGSNNMIEFSPAGTQLAIKNVDTGPGGSIFGMVASGTNANNTQIYFNDDNANSVEVLTH